MGRDIKQDIKDIDWGPLQEFAVKWASHPAVQQVGAAALQLGVSSAAYTSTLAVCHLAAGCARISCATPLLAPLAGAASVAAASVAAGHVSRCTLGALQAAERGGGGLAGAVALLPGRLGAGWSGREAALDALLGPLVFKVLLRHHFSRLLPSHLAKPGAFGLLHVPTSAAEYSTAAEKGQLSVIFGRDGCHHCGTRRNGVIGDHMPPYKVVRDAVAAREAAREAARGLERLLIRAADALGLQDLGLKQVYYAQCRGCSSLQAQLMRCGTRTTRLPGLWPPQLVPHTPARLATRPAMPGMLVGMRYYVGAAVHGPGVGAGPGGGAGGAGGARGKGGGGGAKPREQRYPWLQRAQKQEAVDAEGWEKAVAAGVALLVRHLTPSAGVAGSRAEAGAGTDVQGVRERGCRGGRGAGEWPNVADSATPLLAG